MKYFILGILFSLSLYYIYNYFTYKYNENFARTVCLRALDDTGYYKDHVIESYMNCENNIKINSWYLRER